MGKLEEHAEAELRRAGLFDEDSDYGGALAQAVMELVKVHAAQGHSGGSHARVLYLFNQVVNFKPLTSLTSTPAEWMDVSGSTGEPTWQSRRCPSAFSRDGGTTWYDLDKGERPLK